MLPAADAVYQALMEHMPEVTGALDEMSPVIQEIAGDFGDMAAGAFADALPQLAAGLRDFVAWLPGAYDAAKPFLTFLWENKGTVAAFAVALRTVGPAVNLVSKGMAAFSQAKTFFALLQASGKLGQFVTILKAAGTALAGPLGVILAIGTRPGAAVPELGPGGRCGSVLHRHGKRTLPGGGGLPPGLLAVHPGRRRQRPGHHPKPFGFCGQRLCRQLVRRPGRMWSTSSATFSGCLATSPRHPSTGSSLSSTVAHIEGINGLSVDIPDWVPVVGGKQLGFSIPTIPQLAAGGIATRPTLAQIGEGGEPEAVMPLSKLAQLLDQWPKPGPNGRGGGAAGGENITFAPVFNFYGGTPTREEAQEAGRISFAEFKRLYKQMKAEERRKNFRTDPV